MKRIDLLVHVFGTLRRAKQPSLTRLAILSAIAQAGPEGATVRQIADTLDDDNATISGSFQKLPDGGYVRCLDPHQRPMRWVLTQQGIDAITPFLRETSSPAHR